MRRQLIAAAILIIALLPAQASAWGREGHAIIAEIAMQRLTKGATFQVQSLLAGMAPADAANWMDEMRRNGRYRYMQHWHYINIARDSSYRPGGHDDIVYALQMAFQGLKNGQSPDSVRREDLLILFHLVGDLHQPLHTGYASDKGGNKVQVNIGGRKGTNLHHLWDTDIIERQDITLEMVVAFGSRLKPAAIKTMQNGNFISWMEESRSYLPQVYAFKGHKLDDQYISSAQSLIVRQLFTAGVRLATVINSIWEKSPVRPPAKR